MDAEIWKNETRIRAYLDELRREHKRLDEAIMGLAAEANPQAFEVRRLKKKKLSLKDQISRMEAMLIPDIIA